MIGLDQKSAAAARAANFASADARVRDGRVISQLVIRGLDPRIHLEGDILEDGLPGQAR